MAKTSKKREILEAELAAALSKPGVNGVIPAPPPDSKAVLDALDATAAGWDANGAPVDVMLPEPVLPGLRAWANADTPLPVSGPDVVGVRGGELLLVEDVTPPLLLVPSLLRSRVRSGLREYRAGAGWTRNAETAEARPAWELGPGEWTLTREQARVPDVESHGVLSADARALEAARDLQTAEAAQTNRAAIRMADTPIDRLIDRCRRRLARALEAAERASAPRGDE